MPIPNPEPGLVISYAYLWHHEHQTGREEAQKDRPSVIVLAIQREASGATVVTLLPITHSAPVKPASAVETPLPVRRHLGLDDNRPGLWSPKAMNFFGQGRIYASCRTATATTAAFCRRTSSIRCSRPSSIGIKATAATSRRANER